MPRGSGLFLLSLLQLSCGNSVEPVREPAVGPGLAAPEPDPAPSAIAAAPRRAAEIAAPAVPERPGWFAEGGPGSVASRSGMVSSVESNATDAGVAMLELGGNAVDAAVAVAFALAVTHPVAGNVGGGGFLLVGAPGAATVAIDFRERAPLGTTDAAFRRMLQGGARGPLAAGVPGSVAGLLLAHERFGRLPRARVLAPAIALAETGHALGERQALTLRWAWSDLGRDGEARRIFGRPNGGPLRAGDRLMQSDLAGTLRRIAEHGDAGFYAGTTADAIVAAMQAGAGLLTHRDLSEYRALFRVPLVSQYRGVRVEVMSPPSAGGVAVVEMLAMLEQLETWRLERGSVEHLHVFAEVAKRAHADRQFAVVDPDSVETYDASGNLERWQRGNDWLLRFPIGDRATPAAELHPAGQSASEEPENTTHFSVADAEGLVVSCTTTLSRGFGARFVVPGTGVLLNNSFAAFGTAGLDVPKPGRRMTSSMSPALVTLGEQPLLLLGSPGGDTIPNTVVQVLQNLVDYGLPLSAAIDAPRLHHGFVPDRILYESTRPPSAALLRALRRRGHALSGLRRTIGDANLVATWDGMFWGYADPREGGLAAAPARLGSP